jgi:hypothetical protein
MQAATQLGVKESPAGSNHVKFGIWYGIVGAWCAMFVSWVHVMAKVGKTFAKGSRYAYVPYIVADARAGRNGLRLSSGPRSGVIACYDWDHNGVADHTGICADAADLAKFCSREYGSAVNRFGHPTSAQFWAIEGNTAVGNDSNGGEVMIRLRNRSDVQAFCQAF